MNAKDLKRHLQSIIESKLSPLIDSNYVYWDLPYHINIGDTLIWQGTLDFLSDKPYKMMDYGNSVTASLDSLLADTVILLHGGGILVIFMAQVKNLEKMLLKNTLIIK
ncbi:hypothetical protein Q4S33_04500 [Acinetobacter calcoaceticus]|nr:hypothetical protein Q4S33_04500 [Acinetobacter calcoaceticus]